MAKAGQAVPLRPQIPDEATRLLRARLILEEAFETVEALGVTAYYDGHPIEFNDLTMDANMQPNLREIADGCVDMSVVATGTLSACGLADGPLLEIVDENNLAKFGPGHQIVNGKLIKPPGHQPPAIAEEIERQHGK